MRWVFLIQFCVGCWYTIVSGSQLSYTPILEGALDISYSIFRGLLRNRLNRASS